jgi:hypothetical protein
VAGEIFILKACYGYKEGSEINHNLSSAKNDKISIEFIKPSEDKASD